MRIERDEPRTLWSCMTCGAVGDRQSCRNCGAEAMPGEWVPADRYRGAVEERDRLRAAMERAAALDSVNARKTIRQALDALRGVPGVGWPGGR